MSPRATRRAGVALAAGFWLCGCHRPRRGSSEEPRQTLRDLSLSQTRLGAPVWELHAAVARLTEGDKLALLDEPRMTFFERGKVASRVASQSGLVHMESRDVTLSTDVVVQSIDDRSVLKTSELTYSSIKNRFLSDRDVVVTRPGATLRGRGLEATPDLSEVRVFNQRATMEGQSPL